MLKRHAVQVLTQAGHTQVEISKLTGLPERTVRRIQKEEDVTPVDDEAERKKRRVGRPSKVEAHWPFVEKLLEEEPDLESVEILRRVRRRATGAASPQSMSSFDRCGQSFRKPWCDSKGFRESYPA